MKKKNKWLHVLVGAMYCLGLLHLCIAFGEPNEMTDGQWILSVFMHLLGAVTWFALASISLRAWKVQGLID